MNSVRYSILDTYVVSIIFIRNTVPSRRTLCNRRSAGSMPEFFDINRYIAGSIPEFFDIDQYIAGSIPEFFDINRYQICIRNLHCKYNSVQ